MRVELVEAVVRGDRVAWSAGFALWLVAAATVFVLRRPPALRPAGLVVLFTLAAALGVVGLDFAEALALPRLHWRASASPAVVATSGDGWRRLRGPAAYVEVAGVPELALPGIDERGEWMLYGLFSGAPVPGFAPAPNVTPDAGTPRICDADVCRAWPATWPDASKRRAFAELVWARAAGASAMAYDVDAGLYLAAATGLDADRQGLELSGRLSNDPPREGRSALFVLRRIAAGRLDSVRVVAAAGTPEPTYRLERAGAVLGVAPGVARAVVRPALLTAMLAPVLALIALLAAPAVLALRLRGRAVRRVLSRALALAPVAGPSTDPRVLATVAEDADLGDALLARGTVVAALLAPGRGAPVSSKAWFEIPAAAADATAELASAGAGVVHAEGGVARKIGLLVPADPAPFGRVARALAMPLLYAFGVLLTGLAIAAPALAAIAGLAAAR
jgi:hypothetical protein